MIILWVNFSLLVYPSKRFPIHDWVYFLSELNETTSVMIEHLARCHNWISQLNLINPVILFEWISSIYWSDLISFIIWLYFIIHILWSELISNISWFGSFTFTWLLSPSRTHECCWKTLPMNFLIMLLVRTKPHMKYLRTVYPYITSRVHYVKPSCPTHLVLIL